MDLYNIRRIIKPFNMAIISVFISVLSITIVAGISSAGRTEIQRELDSVGLNGMSVSVFDSLGENITDQKLYNQLNLNENISLLTPVLYDYAYIEFSTGTTVNTMCWGISPTAEKIVNLERKHGKMLSAADISNRNNVCLIDENLALQAYGRTNITGKKIYVNISSGVYEFDIVGVVNKGSNILNGMSGEVIPDFIYIPFTTMEKIYRKENLDQILINVTDEEITEDNIRNYIISTGEYNPASTIKITNLNQQREAINSIVDIAFIVLFLIACVAVVVCSISVAASVNTAVNAAKHDIGIKISLGASKINIISEFLIHSVLACIIGIISGYLAGIFLLIIANIMLQKNYTFDYSLILRGISATIVLSVIFSIYPSNRAANLTPVKALSRE